MIERVLISLNYIKQLILKDTLQFVRADIPVTRLTEKYDTSPER